ncbi:hypothetical protein [Aquipuribacter sp. MA13-6]|uniref:hypothetical protein n=1 Tax=unclassified Aquipuribacter TaxID=2635084 RepID=UPI003EEDA8F6
MAADGGSGSTRTVGGTLNQPHVRLALEMFLLLLGAELTRTLPLPWRLAGLVFSVLALVQGIRALRAVRAHRTGNRDGLPPGPTGGVLVLVGVVVAVVLTVVQVAMLAAYPLVQDQESCRDRALTRTALERCDDELFDRIEQLGVSVPGS